MEEVGEPYERFSDRGSHPRCVFLDKNKSLEMREGFLMEDNDMKEGR